MLLLIALLATATSAQTGSPSEQRKWVLETTRWLEQNPLHADTRKHAAALLKWWVDVPDLTLSVCPLLIETKNKRISPTAVSQAMFSAGAYLIEHAEATRTELSLAGVEGALRAYSTAVAANPKMRDKFLDGLLQAQSEGKLLEGYVTPVVAKCEAAEHAKH